MGRMPSPRGAPADGSAACFVEATFPGGTVPLTLTTSVVGRPDSYPHPPFEPATPRDPPVR